MVYAVMYYAVIYVSLDNGFQHIYFIIFIFVDHLTRDKHNASSALREKQHNIYIVSLSVSCLSPNSPVPLLISTDPLIGIPHGFCNNMYSTPTIQVYLCCGTRALGFAGNRLSSTLCSVT
jgi:hypothetical protein